MLYSHNKQFSVSIIRHSMGQCLECGLHASKPFQCLMLHPLKTALVVVEVACNKAERSSVVACMDAVYNNSFVRRYLLPFAEYSLWSKCRIETPGVCSSAPALCMKVYLLVATTVFNTIHFY